MTIKREDALSLAVRCLSAKIEDRLEIVESISGVSYGSPVVDADKAWIVRIQPESLTLDGKTHYIVIDRETGETTEVETT